MSTGARRTGAMSTGTRSEVCYLACVLAKYEGVRIPSYSYLCALFQDSSKPEDTCEAFYSESYCLEYLDYCKEAGITEA